MRNWTPWVPGGVLGVGCLFTLFINRQQEVPLAQPLTNLPASYGEFRGTRQEISEAEQKAAGMSDYSFQTFAADSLQDFTVYVGYYDHQTQGKTIHSPKNCLPGSGWEALQQSETTVATAGGKETVNRYLLQNGAQQALVFYWYQGRGRVAANEYRVKWELLRDAALRGRTEEALVRIVVWITPKRNQAQAEQLATRVADQLIPSVYRILPS